MRPPEVVFDEPLGKSPVEDLGIVREVPEGKKFVLERAVEPFVHRIVFWGFHAGPIMRYAHRTARVVEMAVKFAPIVSLHILDLSIKQEMQAREEIAGGCRTVGRVHPRKGDFDMPVDGSKNIPRASPCVADDGVEAEEKARDRLPLEFGDLPARPREASFPVGPSLFLRMVVQP